MKRYRIDVLTGRDRFATVMNEGTDDRERDTREAAIDVAQKWIKDHSPTDVRIIDNDREETVWRWSHDAIDRDYVTEFRVHGRGGELVASAEVDDTVIDFIIHRKVTFPEALQLAKFIEEVSEASAGSIQSDQVRKEIR